jgi:hypothetical protein
LNQDCVENFFAWIRATGLTYTTPSALDFKYRFRKFLLSSSTTHYQTQSNCTQSPSKTLACNLLLETQDSPKTSHLLQTTSVQLPSANEDDQEFELPEYLEERNSCLLGDTFDIGEELLNSPLDDEESLEIPEMSEALHHKSERFKNYVNKLGISNGIFVLAAFLSRKHK